MGFDDFSVGLSQVIYTKFLDTVPKAVEHSKGSSLQDGLRNAENSFKHRKQNMQKYAKLQNENVDIINYTINNIPAHQLKFNLNLCN